MRYKTKKISIDANFIDFSKPFLWPDGIINNPDSPTGVSYLSLDELPVPDAPPGSVYVPGFPVLNMSWLVFDWQGQAQNLTDEEFQQRFEL